MNDYELLDPIGQGQYGVVYKVRCKSDGQIYCMKRIPLNSKEDNKSALREVELLASLNHPNIIAYKASFLDDTGALCIVTTFAEDGDLFTKIRQRAAKQQYFSEAEVMAMFIQIASALNHIHGRKILHRDLKTQNIFIARGGIIKLGDFGISRILEKTDQFATTVTGTPYYMAPEVCTNQPYTFKSDIWSLGCVLYEMCTLKHAFAADSLLSLVYAIVRGNFPPIPSNMFSADLSGLVNSLLAREAAQRPSLSQILQTSYVVEHMQRWKAGEQRLVMEKTSTMTRRRELKTQLSRLTVGGGGDGGGGGGLSDAQLAAMTPKERMAYNKKAAAERRAMELQLASLGQAKDSKVMQARKMNIINNSSISCLPGAQQSRRPTTPRSSTSPSASVSSSDGPSPASSMSRFANSNATRRASGPWDSIIPPEPSAGGGAAGGSTLPSHLTTQQRAAMAAAATPQSRGGGGGTLGGRTNEYGSGLNMDLVNLATMPSSVNAAFMLSGANPLLAGTDVMGGVGMSATLNASRAAMMAGRAQQQQGYALQQQQQQQQQRPSSVPLNSTYEADDAVLMGTVDAHALTIHNTFEASTSSSAAAAGGFGATRRTSGGPGGLPPFPSQAGGGGGGAAPASRAGSGHVGGFKFGVTNPPEAINVFGSQGSSSSVATPSTPSADVIRFGIRSDSKPRGSFDYLQQQQPAARSPDGYGDDFEDEDSYEQDFEDYDPDEEQAEVNQRVAMIDRISEMQQKAASSGAAAAADAAASAVQDRAALDTKSTKTQAMRAQCKEKLGRSFDPVYAYLLRVRHSSGFTDEAKVQQKLLELVGGDRSRMASCFIVDQLVFMELMAQQRR